MKSSHPSLVILACTFALFLCDRVVRATETSLTQNVASIAGVVVDAAGAPIEGARVTSMSTTVTDARGGYRLDVAGPGRVLVEVSAPGYALASTQVDVVLAGRTTRVPDVVLLVKPTIAGVVVGRGSVALAGVVVEAMGSMPRFSARAVTDERGAFELALDESAPHAVTVRGVPGYFDRGAFDAPVQIGTSDLRIVLEPRRRMTFSVVDAATNEPVRAGSVAVEHAARSTVTTRDLDGSSVLIEGSASFDVGAPPAQVVVRSDALRALPDLADVAYLPFRGPLVADAERMTIRLERAGIVRYALDQRDTRVEVRRAGVLEAGKPEEQFPELESSNSEHRWYRALPPGRYDFRFIAPRHLEHVVRDVVVDPAKPVDLGRIALDIGGVARVRLSLPDGVSPIGLRVRVDDGEERTFEHAIAPIVFTGLAPGEHALTLLANPPRVPSERRMTFTVGRGEYVDVRFLARD